jgi:hypothetical protein
MRTGYLVDTPLVILLALTACAAPSRTDTTTQTQPGERTAISVDGASVQVAIDPTQVAPGAEPSIEVVERRGARILLLDGRASRPQGMNRCQAGQERWLRLIDLESRRELYSKLVESCIRDVVPGEPVATWAQGSDEIRVELLSEPSFSIGADGRLMNR